jgi:hypothetical protein
MLFIFTTLFENVGDLIMKRSRILLVLVYMLFLTACANTYSADIKGTQLPNEELPMLQITVGETFTAAINVPVSSVHSFDYMDGQYFDVSNKDDEWVLRVEWRSAKDGAHFFGNPPDSWTNATMEERDEYFNNYLYEQFVNYKPEHEIKEIEITLHWLGFDTDDSYSKINGKMIQYRIDDKGKNQASGINEYVTFVTIEFYSYYLQFDDEGAFFMKFSNRAEAEDRFIKNQEMFDAFLQSIELQRFYQ